MAISVKNFSKILYLLNKSHQDYVDEGKMEKYWKRFNSEEGNPAKLLNHLHLTNELLLGYLKKSAA